DGPEQVELDGALLGLAHTVSEHHAVELDPRAPPRAPRPPKAAPLVVDAMPGPATLDHGLQLGDPLERDADRELHVVLVECGARRIAEVRAVHPGFGLAPEALLAQLRETLHHELRGAARVVAVAGTMKDIEDLTGLR